MQWNLTKGTLAGLHSEGGVQGWVFQILWIGLKPKSCFVALDIVIVV